MPRTLTASQLTAISSHKSQSYYLFKLHTDTPLTITSCYKDIAYNGDTYSSGGFLLEIPNLVDELDLKVIELTITISSVNQINLAAFLLEPPYHRKVELYKIWLDDSGSIIGTPYLRFSGYFSTFEVNEDQSAGKSEMSISCVNEFVDFKRKNGRQTNSASQQKHFPSDTGLRHAESVINELNWGKP